MSMSINFSLFSYHITSITYAASIEFNRISYLYYTTFVMSPGKLSQVFPLLHISKENFCVSHAYA